MKKYLTQKIIDEEAAEKAKAIDKNLEFKNGMREMEHETLNRVDDFQKPMVKDVPREHIVTKPKPNTDLLPEGSAWKKELDAKRAALRAKSGRAPIEEKTIDYNEFKNSVKKASPLMKTGLKAMGPLSAVAQVTPALADIKEGNNNTAAARLLTGMAPLGTESLQQDLMDQAGIADQYPSLQDPTYLRTLQNIGKRRVEQGKSPVVEGFDGEQVDTSATEKSDFLNKLNAIRRQNSQG